MVEISEELSQEAEAVPAGETSPDLKIHGEFLVKLARFLDSRGKDLQKIAVKGGFSFGPESAWPNVFISQVDYSRFLERLAVQLAEPNLGLKIGVEQMRSSKHVVPLAGRYAPTPLDALRLFARFAVIAMDMERCEVVVDKEEVAFIWNVSPILHSNAQISDMLTAEIVWFFSTSLTHGALTPLRVELVGSPRGNKDDYRRYLSRNVTFGAAHNRIVFPLSCLTLPNDAADAPLFEALVELCERRVADQKQLKSIEFMVREVAAGRIDRPDLSLEMVAKEMGMSPRMLQRRLSDNGATFQEILDNMRRELATEMLLDPDRPISAIAYRLGFSAVGNFTRAAKRWFGMPPTRWRQEQLRKPV